MENINQFKNILKKFQNGKLKYKKVNKMCGFVGKFGVPDKKIHRSRQIIYA